MVVRLVGFFEMWRPGLDIRRPVFGGCGRGGGRFGHPEAVVKVALEADLRRGGGRFGHPEAVVKVALEADLRTGGFEKGAVVFWRPRRRQHLIMSGQDSKRNLGRPVSKRNPRRCANCSQKTVAPHLKYCKACAAQVTVEEIQEFQYMQRWKKAEEKMPDRPVLVHPLCAVCQDPLENEVCTPCYGVLYANKCPIEDFLKVVHAKEKEEGDQS
jgi:hypothetical protein